MLTENGPKIIEYNCRFRDPECQAVMPLVSGDFAQFCLDGAKGWTCLSDCCSGETRIAVVEKAHKETVKLEWGYGFSGAATRFSSWIDQKLRPPPCEVIFRNFSSAA